MNFVALFFAVMSQAVSTPPVAPPPPAGIPWVEEEYDIGESPHRTNCPVPHPKAEDRFLLLGFYEGSAVADHAIAGLDKETTTGEIHVLPGRSPIFLVLSSNDPMIFRFTGSVRRLSQVVVLHDKGGGVTGVPANRVSFGIGQNCSVGDSTRGVAAAKVAAQIFGKIPNRSNEGYDLHKWILISRTGGRPISAPRSESKGTYLEQELGRFYPGGVVAIDTKTLISSRTAEAYQILPSTAGAVQLERRGSLVPASTTEVSAWIDKASRRYGKEIVSSISTDVYRVTRPIDLPIGLCGAHRLTFLVQSADHVRGDPCHSDIVTLDGTILTRH